MKSIRRFFITHWVKVLAFIIALAIIVCSVTLLAKTFTNPQTYKSTIKSIDEKKVTVLGVSTAIAGTATLLAAVPDDATTPLADEMMDLSSYLVVVVLALVLEKSLLTVFGAIACYIIIPLACVFGFLHFVNKNAGFNQWAIKFTVLALIVLCIIPGSMKLSDYIYEVNQVSIEQEVEAIEDKPKEESKKDTPWYKKVWDSVTKAVKKSVDSAVEKGKKALNQFIDAVSVFVIAYCAIPIFIVFVFLWFIKFLFGIQFNFNVHTVKPNLMKAKRKEHTEDLSFIE